MSDIDKLKEWLRSPGAPGSVVETICKLLDHTSKLEMQLSLIEGSLIAALLNVPAPMLVEVDHVRRLDRMRSDK